MWNDRRVVKSENGAAEPESPRVSAALLALPDEPPHSTRVIHVTRNATLGRVLDQLRDGPSGSATLLLDPLSLLFSTPDHFRALDAVRIARQLAVTIEVADAHRTGLALAFGYRVRLPGDHVEAGTAPVPDVQYGPPNRTGALRVAAQRPPPPAPATAPEAAANRAVRHRRLPRGLRALLLGVGITLCALVVAILALFQVQTADVTVRPVERSFSRVVPFAVSVSPSSDPNTLQTTLFQTTIAREGDAAATGTTTVPDGTATGVVTLRSRADGAISLKAGTALKGPRNVSYLLQSDVTVPGLDFVRGTLGEASVKVRASLPGPAGNLGAGFSARYNDNVTFISGDITGGTEKKVAVVSDADIAGLRARLEDELRLHALTEVNAALSSGTTALNDYLSLSAPAVIAQPSVGTQSDSVHLRVTITAQIPVYQNADFDALINRRLSEALHDPSVSDGGASQVLPETVVKTKPVFVDVQGPLVRYFATVSGKTRAILTPADLARLRAALVGKDATEAERRIAAAPAVGDYTIRYGPSWLPLPLRNRMPRVASHIHMHLGTRR